VVAAAGKLQGGVGLKYGGIADVIANETAMLSRIHATSASLPMRHTRPSLLAQTPAS
jgi:hypothetical protein